VANATTTAVRCTAVLLGEDMLATQRADRERITKAGLVPLVVTLAERRDTSVAIFVTMVALAPPTVH
jgi:hypothetical protein